MIFIFNLTRLFNKKNCIWAMYIMRIVFHCFCVLKIDVVLPSTHSCGCGMCNNIKLNRLLSSQECKISVLRLQVVEMIQTSGGQKISMFLKQQYFCPIHRCLFLIYRLKYRFLVADINITIFLVNLLIQINCIGNIVKCSLD